MPVDTAEDRPLLDPGMGEPIGQVAHRTPTSTPMPDGNLAPFPGLIGFRAAQVQHDPLPHMLDIFAVQPDQFRATEGSGKAGEQQGLVPDVDWAVPDPLRHHEQVVALQSLHFGLRCASDPTVLTSLPSRSQPGWNPHDRMRGAFWQWLQADAGSARRQVKPRHQI